MSPRNTRFPFAPPAVFSLDMHPTENGLCSCATVAGVKPWTEKPCAAPLISVGSIRSARPSLVVNCVNARTCPS